MVEFRLSRYSKSRIQTSGVFHINGVVRIPGRYTIETAGILKLSRVYNLILVETTSHGAMVGNNKSVQGQNTAR